MKQVVRIRKIQLVVEVKGTACDLMVVMIVLYMRQSTTKSGFVLILDCLLINQFYIVHLFGLKSVRILNS